MQLHQPRDMSLLQAAEAALTELRDLHPDIPQCPGPQYCPTARAILDLELAIGEEKLKTVENEAEATYPPMKVEDV